MKEVNRMSLFYFTVKNITKANQSAVASASYRSGQDLYSDRDQETKFYRKRTTEPDTFILAPDYVPEWVYNREKLWNEVEAIERNWNARLSREVLVALPRELENDVQNEMLAAFVESNFVDKGMVADVSIHRDKEDNPHAHIMLTVRPFNKDGSWGNKKKKEYVKDVNGDYVYEDGKKKYKTIQLTDWDRKETLIEWRKHYADIVNEYYLKYNINESVSHESYEKQGLDKLPRQRLTLKEYTIEKKEKESAEKEGREYQPRTYYAKQNKEIEEANKELEKIAVQIEFAKQKIVYLTDYRDSKFKEEIEKLNQIRKSINLSSYDWQSLKIVANRVDGFIDIHKAKENVRKLNNWKKKLENERKMLMAERKVLIRIQNTYNGEPKKTLLYGIIPSKYKEQFSEKANSFNERKLENDKALKAFNDLYERSLRVLEIQKQFAIEEFNFLYPQYANKFENNENVIELKSKYVELFRNEGIRRNSIVEFEHDTYKLNSSYAQLNSLIKDWTELNNSLVILERTKEKYKGEYRKSYESFDAEKTYKDYVKYTESKEQIFEKEVLKYELKEQLSSQFAMRYSDIPIETMKEIPSDIQAKVLELHLKNEQTGKLSEDLTIVKEMYMQKDYNKEFKNPNFEEQSKSNVANDTGMLLDALINVAKQIETKDQDLEAERQKKKKHKKLLYNKLEMQIGE